MKLWWPRMVDVVYLWLEVLFSGQTYARHVPKKHFESLLKRHINMSLLKMIHVAFVSGLKKQLKKPYVLWWKGTKFVLLQGLDLPGMLGSRINQGLSISFAGGQPETGLQPWMNFKHFRLARRTDSIDDTGWVVQVQNIKYKQDVLLPLWYVQFVTCNILRCFIH